MEALKPNPKENKANSKGAAIFKKMLDDKKAISEHIKKGGKISDLKNKFNFVKPLQSNMENLLTRITINTAVCNGKPTIHSMRFTVAQLLELLAAGMTRQEILSDYPYLEEADIKACSQHI